jgi:hypothetical protein
MLSNEGVECFELMERDTVWRLTPPAPTWVSSVLKHLSSVSYS